MTTYIRKNVIEANSWQDFMSAIGINSAEDIVRDEFGSVKAIFENFDEKSVFVLKGVEGTGKSSFANLILNSFEKEVMIFKYNFSEITTLDDIFFDFYRFILKSPYKKALDLNSGAKLQSVDEKIVNFLKKTKIPLVILFDSFENAVDKNSEISSVELLNFIQYLSVIPNIKIILCSSHLNERSLKISESDLLSLRLYGLEELQTMDFISSKGMNVSTHLSNQIHTATSGYFYSILFLKKGVENISSTYFDILKEYFSQNDNIETFLAKKMFSVLSLVEKRFLIQLALVRHQIPPHVFKVIFNIENFDNILQKLKKIMFIEEVEGNIYLRNFIRNLILNEVKDKDKISVHNTLANFYAEQIPLKILERTISISRASMYSEKFYHVNAVSKIEKSSQITSTLTQGFEAPQREMKMTSENIKYIASSQIYTQFFDNKKPEEKQPEPQSESKASEEAKKALSDVYDKTSQTDYSRKIEYVSKEPIRIEIDMDKEIDLKLSAEEMALLEEEEKEERQNNEFYDENDSGIEMGLDIGLDASFAPQDMVISNEEEEEEEEKDKAEHLLERAQYFYNNNDLMKCTGYFKAALSLFEERSDEEKINITSLSLAKALSDLYKQDEAIFYLNNILSKENISFRMKTLVYIELGDIYEYKKEYERAINSYKQALLFNEGENDIQKIAKIYFKMGIIYDDMGDLNKAVEYYKKNTEICEDVSLNDYLASSFANLASIAEELHKDNEAEEFYNKSLEIDVKTKNYVGQAKTYDTLARMAFANNNIVNAIKFFMSAVQAAKSTKDSFLIASSYLELGDLYFSLKNYENALKCFIMAKKNIDETISLDSKNKIARRFQSLMDEVGEAQYRQLLSEIRKKD